MSKADKETLVEGAWTLSAGTNGQGVAWYARELGLDCTVIVPDNGAQTKIDAMRKMGAKIVRIPMEEFSRARGPP